ncbi:MAG: hypothetical protein R2708_13605 [Vicinamibacterales bacterium]
MAIDAPTASASVAATSWAQRGTACQADTCGRTTFETAEAGTIVNSRSGTGGVHAPRACLTPPRAATSSRQRAHPARCRATAALAASSMSS